MKTIEQKDQNTVVIDGVEYKKETSSVAEPDNWPKLGDEYWYPGGHGVKCAEWDGSSFDTTLHARGEAYRTKEECEQADAVLRATKRCKDWIAANLEAWEPDWEDSMQQKYSVFFDAETKHFFAVRYAFVRPLSPFDYYFRTEKDAEAFISACEADLRVIWGVS